MLERFPFQQFHGDESSATASSNRRFSKVEGVGMIGAIAGDIIGSVYEFRPIKTKDFPLFSPFCDFTMTLY
jgi:hypothetical protein